MTHLFDTSATLALLLNEPGGKRVAEILDDPTNAVAISALTLVEMDAAVLHRTGSKEVTERMISEIRLAVGEIVPVTEQIANLACELRTQATARIATVDCLIAATAVYGSAILVHRDPHFASLPSGMPVQETLPVKL